MIAATQTLFIGWWRPNRLALWTRLIEGDGYDAAWGALLDALASVHGGESMVLRGSEDPNVRRPRPAERRRR